VEPVSETRSSGLLRREMPDVAFSCNCRKNYHLDSSLQEAVKCARRSGTSGKVPDALPFPVDSLALPNIIKRELYEQYKRNSEMAAGSSRSVLSGSDGVRDAVRGLPNRCGLYADAGGWFYCDLPSRSRAYLFRSYVPPVQTGKAYAIVNSAGNKKGPLCEYVRSQNRPILFSLLCRVLCLVDRQSRQWLLIAN
jgi:hypothetical protein